eukprot:jgi/Picre1/31858/NNA_007206.t1
MARKRKEDWSEEENSEDIHDSEDEEIQVALQDPKVKSRLRLENISGEYEKEDEDELEEATAEENGVYAAEKMTEILKDISWGGQSQMWKEGLVLLSREETEIEDVENDLERELAFYNQAQRAAFEAISKFEKEGIPWRRPDDYLAEMVKTDAHMAKVKEQLVHERTVIEESEQRRKERESRKFSKQVAAERRKERSQQRKQAIESVANMRKARAKNNFEGDFDLNEVGLGDKKPKGQKLGDRFSARGKSLKRTKRDAKYGFGGPKRRSKQNDAYSAASGDPKRSKPRQRPGKSRRQKMK